MAVRRSRGWPWKVLRLAVPLGKRMRSGVAALLMLCVDATGVLWSGPALRDQQTHRSYTSVHRILSFCKHGTQQFTVTIFLCPKAEKSVLIKPDPGVSQDWSRRKLMGKGLRKPALAQSPWCKETADRRTDGLSPECFANCKVYL